MCRRTLLAAGATALGATVALSGCTSGDDSDDARDAGETSDGDDGTTTTDGDATGTGELDLREANVTGVEVTENGGGEYRLSVTLYHDDDGEDGYADRWVVERRDGTELGRRELAHAHSTAPFTRSTTVTVPDDVACVVVRGHDQTHGYGGRAALVTLDGTKSFHDQGSDRSSLAGRDCPG